MMKNKLLALGMSAFLVCAALISNGQDKKLPPLDQSPMDMAYYPPMYPYLVKLKGQPGNLVARVIYSRPQKKGRKIFGELEEYGKVWRLGANEATEVEFYQPVSIGGKNIAKGRYTLYCIPTANNWTIILNKETDIWGAYKYDEKLDVVRTSIPVTTTANEVEALTMIFEKAPGGANLVMAWDKSQVSLPIKFNDMASNTMKKR